MCILIGDIFRDLTMHSLPGYVSADSELGNGWSLEIKGLGLALSLAVVRLQVLHCSSAYVNIYQSVNSLFPGNVHGKQLNLDVALR